MPATSASAASPDPYDPSEKVTDTSVPRHVLAEEDVPNEYKGFVFTTKGHALPSGSLSNPGSGWSVLDGNEFTGGHLYVPDGSGSSVIVPNVGTWTDPDGNRHDIDSKWEVVDENQGAILDYQGSAGFGGDQTGVSRDGRRTGIGLKVTFLYAGTQMKVPDSFKGVTGFADLDGIQPDDNLPPIHEGVELIDGFDGMYQVTSDPHLTAYGDNGLMGTTDTHTEQTSTSSVHDQQHMFSATFSGPSFTIRYSMGPAVNGYAAIFAVPLFKAQVSGSVSVRYVDGAGREIRKPTTVSDRLTEGGTWDAGTPPTIDGYDFKRLADGSAPLKGTMASPVSNKVVTLVYAKRVALSFDGNTTDRLSVPVPSPQTVEEGGKVGEPTSWIPGSTEIRAGFSFDGWYDGDGGTGSKHDFSKPLTADSTVHARWVPLPGGVQVTKRATPNDEDGDGKLEHGETVSYSFEVRNTGRVALTGVKVTDGKLGEVIDVGNLAVGETRTVKAKKDHAVTLEEAASGKVDNKAVASGKPANGSGEVTGRDAQSVATEAPSASLTVTKEPALDDANGNGRADAGEALGWRVTVSNDGDVDLTDVTVDDGKAGISGLKVADALEAGKSVTIETDKRAVIEDEVRGGKLENVARATGRLPAEMGGRDVSDEGSAKVETSWEEPVLASAPSGDGVASDSLAQTGDGSADMLSGAMASVGTVTVIAALARRGKRFRR